MCQSRYLLQIVRCDDLFCCTARRTNYAAVLGDKFILPPISLKVNRTSPEHRGTHQRAVWRSVSKLLVEPHDQHRGFCSKMNEIKNRLGVSCIGTQPKCLSSVWEVLPYSESLGSPSFCDRKFASNTEEPEWYGLWVVPKRLQSKMNVYPTRVLLFIEEENV